MPATRKSARIAEQPSSQENDAPQSSPRAAAGQKRKSEASSPAAKSKRGKKEQKTLEEVLPTDQENKEDERDSKPNDEEMKEAAEQVEDEHKAEPRADTDNAAKTNGENHHDEDKPSRPSEQDNDPEKSEANGVEEHGESKDTDDADTKKSASDETEPPKANGHSEESKPEANGNQNEGKESSDDTKNTSRMDDTGAVHKNEDGKKVQDEKTDSHGALEISKEREESEPSNILEKGIIYFFIRGRVGTGETPDSPDEIQRAYMVLRPLPDGAKLTEGAIPELNNCRLLALPKKVWPKSPQDRFMCFVEKAGTTVKALKEEFMKGSDYATKTAGTTHTPPVTPIGEGPYAITTQGRDSHLAYIVTIPEKVGEVQTDIGLADRGSFVLSTKNPQFAGPANSNLPQSAEFSKEILEEFRSLRWMATQPKHMDYANAQFLLIGEHAGDFGRATEQADKDAKDDKETPAEELEKLEDEDQFRAEALKEDNAVFADLDISKKDYPKVQTTW